MCIVPLSIPYYNTFFAEISKQKAITKKYTLLEGAKIVKKERESNIEALKLIAMLMIVLHHVINTLANENAHYISDFVLNVGRASTNIQSVILAWMWSSGQLGNIIFFVCSAWFLLESNEVDYKKVICMLADVWIVNIIIFAIFELGGWFSISVEDLIKTAFPNTVSLNWYVTCYILFYLIHVKLNQIIAGCTQQELLTTVCVMLNMYYGIAFIYEDVLFATNLVRFIVIYFVIAYMKKFLPHFCKYKKQNLLVFFAGFIGTPIIVMIMNYLRLRISAFENQVAHFSTTNSSPFLLLSGIALFNLFRSKKFVNHTINKIASLSLLVYIIHENYLLREYVRPLIWRYIYEKFGYSQVLLLTAAIALAIFV